MNVNSSLVDTSCPTCSVTALQRTTGPCTAGGMLASHKQAVNETRRERVRTRLLCAVLRSPCRRGVLVLLALSWCFSTEARNTFNNHSELLPVSQHFALSPLFSTRPRHQQQARPAPPAAAAAVVAAAAHRPGCCTTRRRRSLHTGPGTG